MATIDVKNLTKAVAQLVKTLNPRNRDIVSRRFGLKNGTKETLESIGKSYGITRERVRQIEDFALAVHGASQPPAFAAIEMTISSRCHWLLGNGRLARRFRANCSPNVWTHRRIVSYETSRPRSARSSSTWR